MSVVRMNITLPEEVARQLDEVAEPKKKSRFIAEAVQKKIDEEKEAKLESMLREGYQTTRDQSLRITREFEAVDLEGWDEY